MPMPTIEESLAAFRDIVAAAEEQGWDSHADLAPILDRARDAYAAAKEVCL